MYIPDPFRLEDPATIRKIVVSHGFALLITAVEGRIEASHLPFLHRAEPSPHGRLVAHMARANPQWRDLARLAADEREALVVFSGPHAYVSPSWYPPGPAVPTWNYLAVHAYGRPRLIEDPAEARRAVEDLVTVQESSRPAPWRLDGQAPDYLAKMLRDIVAFEIPIRCFEAKAKLSQNHPEAKRLGAARGLAACDDADSQRLAAIMLGTRQGTGDGT